MSKDWGKIMDNDMKQPKSDKYDSTKDTKDHQAKVKALMFMIANKIDERAREHDASKLESPEKDIFDEVTPRLKGLTYGSEEYKASLADMGPALTHHYENNRHHPEHFPDGVNDMDLVNLIEMISDWKAATLRHTNGDIMKSLEINKGRFRMSDQLYKILLNTVNNYLK